ncbi:MAG: ABC transporter ATP-binding protein [Albidovulum sp.]
MRYSLLHRATFDGNAMRTIGDSYVSKTDTTGTLRLSDVCLRLEGKDILSDLNLTVSERRVGVVGRNGSGKTSLARVISGLVMPTSGTVEVAGVDVAKDRKAAIRAVGILFQNPDHQIIFPTVEEEIAFGLVQLGHTKVEAAQETAAMLNRFEKAHWAKATIHLLSQGQKQLVCLMSVLAMDPAVIILDEPLSGLDLPTRMQLLRYLGTVKAQLLHISHDPANLAEYDRVIWLEAGRIVADGPATPVLNAFTQKMTKIGAADDISDLAG